jgi:pimeloyl-ACP methyl ester carboxylesterase
MKLVSLFILLITLISCSTLNTKELIYDSELNGYEYPFKVETFTFNSQNQELNMRYMDIGENSDKVVVLLHGKNFSGFYWERIANDLVKKGYRVIIPDQIGFGKSTKPSSYQYSFSQLALNTNNLLKSLNISKYSVVGHSMGGMLAINMSYLFNKNVTKLVLLNPIGLETYLDYAKFKDTNFFYKNELSKNINKVRNYQKKNYYDGKWNDEYEKLLIPTKGQLNHSDWSKVAWNNALTYGPIFSNDSVAIMKKLKLPTYLVIGTRDKTGPGRNWKKDGVTHKLGNYKVLAKQTKRNIKGSKLYTLKGLGHMPHFEDYERFSKVFYKIFR